MTRPTSRTELAMMSRGIDSTMARSLRERGYSLAKLQSSSKKKLGSLGFTLEQIDAISIGRPAIPSEVLTKVLFENRFLCCICRDSEKSIVLHHIVPWAKTRDHSPSNLAVVCLDHHNEAHTTRGLAISLDGAKLRAHKKAWEAEVKKLDPLAIQRASRLDSDAWYFFNHIRLFELAKIAGIQLKKLKGFRAAFRAGAIDGSGITLVNSPRERYMYSGGDGIQRYLYVKEVMDRVLEVVYVKNISDYLDRSAVPLIVEQGDLIYVQGAHTFSSPMGNEKGRSQLCKGKRKVNHIEVTFAFNRWEATSMSAWGSWLRGRQAVGSLVQVKKIERVSGNVRIEGTALGICACLEGMKNREYASLSLGGIIFRSEAEWNLDN